MHRTIFRFLLPLLLCVNDKINENALKVVAVTRGFRGVDNFACFAPFTS